MQAFRKRSAELNRVIVPRWQTLFDDLFHGRPPAA
jgi:hypothetical protein